MGEHDRTVRVAIAGVGNCAASLAQGIHYYADADPASRIPGLMHPSGTGRPHFVDAVAHAEIEKACESPGSPSRPLTTTTIGIEISASC